MKSAIALAAAIVLLGCVMPVTAANLANFENGLGRDQKVVGGDISGFFFSDVSVSTFWYADITTNLYNVSSDNGTTYWAGDYFVSGWVGAYLADARAVGRIDLTSAAPGIKLGYTSSCPLTLEAFDSAGQKIGSVSGGMNMKPDGSGLAYLELTPQSGMISYVSLKADIPVEGEGFWMIDNVQVVPEPASILWLSISLGGLLIRRRVR